TVCVRSAELNEYNKNTRTIIFPGDQTKTPLPSPVQPSSDHAIRALSPPSRGDYPLQQPPAQFGPRSGHAIIFFGPPFHHSRLHPVGPVRVDHRLAQGATLLRRSQPAHGIDETQPADRQGGWKRARS